MRTHFRWISFRVLPREIFFWSTRSTRSSTTPVVACFDDAFCCWILRRTHFRRITHLRRIQQDGGDVNL
jgi:hypothetical protein